MSNRSRNTNGFSSSPRSPGLISRVIGPWRCPRVRWTMRRGRWRVGAVDETALAWVIAKLLLVGVRCGCASRRLLRRRVARALQGAGPPREFVEHGNRGGLQMRQVGERLAVHQHADEIRAADMHPPARPRHL